ncbi:Uncharacterised protein [Vibrio cholerae]|uniref:Uncharacterized protein n=1 Tax=Vibrio cholerae TaxID=666 RepID=A0A655ZIK4_VIBCL|nr:Uncharacterised protein [Vibrio cholerae]CSB16621.1 Uncharacterised protein [Vibrio cholerae]CSC38217.1 Uncharacterised protein [Vibrio cholerae]CSC69433.1 Uncharacterised protein [Vibrio cholerae]CSD23635.1 Uncharacterised protein [Vibrio cholerae]
MSRKRPSGIENQFYAYHRLAQSNRGDRTQVRFALQDADCRRSQSLHSDPHQCWKHASAMHYHHQDMR